MILRHGCKGDLKEIAELEKISYPAAEAADEDSIKKRLEAFPDRFWLLEEEGRIISFINGPITKEPHLTDEMYSDPSFHHADGEWQMIFSVVTDPRLRGKGYAGKVMERVISDAKSDGLKGIVLTCKERLLPFYSSFGFKNEGISKSVHGGAVWYQMRLTF